MARKTNLIAPLYLAHQITPRYQFSLKSDKVNILAIWQPFWKIWRRLKFFFNCTIMFVTRNHPKISIFIEIGQSRHSRDLAAILKQNGSSLKKFESTIMLTTLKTTYSNLNCLSSYNTFWDIKCQSWKIQKNGIKRAITPTSVHGLPRKLHSR